MFLLLCALSSASCALPVWTGGEVPFVPTPFEVVDRMLELAEVKKSDVVYDLGSGDGRIVIRAAKKYGARGVGVEIDADLVQRARRSAWEAGVSHLVEFREEDALKADVSPATVVTLYMLPDFNARLSPILSRQLKPGARVVAHDFPLEGWVAVKTERVPGDLFHDHRLYLFIIE